MNTNNSEHVYMLVGEMVQQHIYPNVPNNAFIGQQQDQMHHPQQQMFPIGQYTGQQTVQMQPQHQIYGNEPIAPNAGFFGQQHVQLYQENQSCPNGPNAGLIGQQPAIHKHPNPAHHINPNGLNAGFFGQQHIQMDPQHQICLNGPNSGLVGQPPVQIQPQNQNQYPIGPNAGFVSQQNVQTHPQHQNEHQLVEMQQQHQFQQNSYPYSSPQQIWEQQQQQYPMMGIGNPNQQQWQQNDMMPSQTMGPQQMSQFNSNQNSASDPNQFSDLTLQAEKTQNISESAKSENERKKAEKERKKAEQERKKKERAEQRKIAIAMKDEYMETDTFKNMRSLAMTGIDAVFAFAILQQVFQQIPQFVKSKTNKKKVEDVVVEMENKKKASKTTKKNLKEYKTDPEKIDFIAKRVGELIYKIWSEKGRENMAKLLASNDEVEWADPQKHIFANEKHNKGADDQNKNAVVKQNGIWVFDGQFNLLALALILKRKIPITPHELFIKMECICQCEKYMPEGLLKATCLNPFHYAIRKMTPFDKWRYESDSGFGQSSSSTFSQPQTASSSNGSEFGTVENNLSDGLPDENEDEEMAEMELQFDDEDEDIYESDN